MTGWLFIKYLLQFIKSTAFREGELDVAKRSFNPLKFLFVVGVIISALFSWYYAVSISKLQTRVEMLCPSISRLVELDGIVFDISNTRKLGDYHATCIIKFEPVE